MKKLLFITSIVTTILVGCGPEKANTSSAKEYIPADTIFYAGTETPINFDKQIELNKKISLFSNKVFLGSLDDTVPGPKTNKFVNTFVSGYIKGINDKTVAKEYGFSDEGYSYMYIVGLSIVKKFSIGDADKMWAKLDEAEKTSGLTHETKNSNKVDYRVYSLSDTVNLLASAHDGFFTFVLTPVSTDQSDIDIALSLQKPKIAITSESSYYNHIIKKNVGRDFVSYINSVEAAKAITTIDGNRFAKAFAELEKQQAEMGNVIPDSDKDLKTAVCATEIQGIAQNWPGIVLTGTVSSTDDNTEFKIDLLVESHNKVIMNALKLTQGHVSSIAQDPSALLGAGIGFDILKQVTSVRQILDESQNPVYACKPLAEAQKSLKQANTRSLAMMQGMLGALKGISVAVYDFTLDNTKKNIGSYDALMTFSHDNPVQLLAGASFLLPELSDLAIVDDGKPVQINSVLKNMDNYIKQPVYLTLSGQHLNIFSGEKGKKESEMVNKENVSSNAVLVLHADLNKIEKIAGEQKEMKLDDYMDETPNHIGFFDLKASVESDGFNIQLIQRIDLDE